jgi:hypothetical protein
MLASVLYPGHGSARKCQSQPIPYILHFPPDHIGVELSPKLTPPRYSRTSPAPPAPAPVPAPIALGAELSVPEVSISFNCSSFLVFVSTSSPTGCFFSTDAGAVSAMGSIIPFLLIPYVSKVGLRGGEKRELLTKNSKSVFEYEWTENRHT